MSRKLFSLLSGAEIELAPGAKILPAAEFSTLHEAQELLEKVQQEAQEFKRSSVQEAEQMKEHGFQRGFQEGLDAFNQQLASLDHAMKELHAEIHKNILPLALKAAKKIVGEELKLHPDRIVEIVMTALKPVTSHRKVMLYVHRDDLEALESSKPKLKALFEELDSLSIQERPDVEPGGCIIETEAGIINAQLKNQWRALELAFAAFMKK